MLNISVHANTFRETYIKLPIGLEHRLLAKEPAVKGGSLGTVQVLYVRELVLCRYLYRRMPRAESCCKGSASEWRVPGHGTVSDLAQHTCKNNV